MDFSHVLPKWLQFGQQMARNLDPLLGPKELNFTVHSYTTIVMNEDHMLLGCLNFIEIWTV
jgi:hypothetical protein